MADTGEIASRFEKIRLDRIDTEDTTFQHRETLDVRLLAADIQANGQTTPVFVRPAVRDDHFQVISGFRRLEAIRRIHGPRAMVLARVFTTCGDEQAVRLAVSENFQRKDFTAMEKARLCQQLKTEGMTYREIGRAIARGPKTVKNFLSLLRADQTIQRAVQVGDITTSVAVLLAREENVFPPPDHTLEAVIACTVDREYSVNEVRQLLRELKKDEARPDVRPRRGRGPFRCVVERLLDGGGFDLVVKWRKTRGLDELREIIDTLERYVERLLKLEVKLLVEDLD